MTAHTTTLKELEKNYTGTYSVKDNSVRGRKEVSFYNLKVGDKVLINNYFTLIIEEVEEVQEVEEMTATNENIKYLEGIREELEAIYNGTTEEMRYDEPINFYDYVNECLDFNITLNSDMTYRSCKLYVTLGGPNVWIDTDSNEIKLAWGTDRESIWLPSEICNELNSVMEELYNCR